MPARFAVGKPIFAPRPAPCVTMPRMRYGCERSRFAPAEVAGGDQLPDPRAGDERAVDFHRRDDVERDAGRRGQLSQPADRAFAVVAEVKIRPFDHRLAASVPRTIFSKNSWAERLSRASSVG